MLLGEREGVGLSLALIHYPPGQPRRGRPALGAASRHGKKGIVYVFQGKKMKAVINLNNKDYKKKQRC